MGIPIVYFRSSSFNCDRFCPMQYYFQYVLGRSGPSNKKADMGTIAHKVLEICALCKKAHQDGEDVIDDPDIGEIHTSKYNDEYLSSIISRVYMYYTSKLTHHFWTEKDFSNITTWVWKALKYKDGLFDPMNREVIAAEPHFDFEIDEEWAEYDYPELGLKGKLAIKGTTDLILSTLSPDVIEVCDWKTGRRLDWATGQTKDQAKFYVDAQLRLYHKAVKHMYPDVHTFIITIFFINDGGAYTIHLTDDDIPKTNEMIKKRFEKIRDTENPKLIRQIDPKQGWKCRKLCHFGKNTFEDDNKIKPMKEPRGGQYTRYGETMTQCEQVRYMIARKGIEWVTENYKEDGFDVGFYKDPGSVE